MRGRLAPALVLMAVGMLSLGAGAATVSAQSAATVVMNEFSFSPEQLVVSAGRDAFTLRNAGQFPHNMHIEGNGLSLDVNPDGNVNGGESFTGAVTLSPGTYDVWCPVGNHRERGMVGTLTVAGAAAGGAAQVPGRLPNTGAAEPGWPIGSILLATGLLLLGVGGFALRRATTRQ
jgi:plastocyanin